MFSRLMRMFSADMAIDLGTANTLFYVRGRGIVFDDVYIGQPEYMAKIAGLI